jgi:lipopolysaccharide transport system permease protein/teichoic acid transport system permease protein
MADSRVVPERGPPTTNTGAVEGLVTRRIVSVWRREAAGVSPGVRCPARVWGFTFMLLPFAASMGVVSEAPAAFRSSNDRPGPAALIRNAVTDVWTRRRLIRYLVRADVKKRGVNTVLGNVWWVLDPLITMLIYVLVMTVIFQRSTPDFPLFLLSAMVPFKWFTATVGSSTSAVTGKENLIKQILFPKIILPVTLSLSQIVSFLFGMAVLLFVWFFAYHDHVTWQVVWIPLIAVVQYVFVLGWTFILSAVTVFYRDVGIVVGHFMRLLFWISPILWSFMEVAGRGARLQSGLEGIERGLGLPTGVLFGIISMNPVSLLIESYRKVVYGNLSKVDVVDETTGEVIGDTLVWTDATLPDFQTLAVIFAIGVVFVVIGTLIFKRLEPSFTKVL